HRAARPELTALARHPVVAVDQPRQRERHVERMPHVVVERVAGEITRVAAREQRLEIVERAMQDRQAGPGIARGEERENRVADLSRLLDVDAVRDVVFVTSVLQLTCPLFPCADYSRSGQKGKEIAPLLQCKKALEKEEDGRRPVSRVL